MNVENQGLQCTPPAINHAFSNALRKVAQKHPQLRKVQSRAPCRVIDLREIIGQMPPGLEDIGRRAACWLLAGQTGARSITMVNIKLCDILSFRLVSDRCMKGGKPLYVVSICYNVAKNISKDWGHSVALEGQTEVRDDEDAVYWLERHLKDNFGLSLHNRASWVLSVEQENTPLFLWFSTDAMAEAFATACEKAGFPSRYFTFHSLRAGFICSALTDALNSNNPKERQAIIERSALIAGWKPGGPSQMLYIKMQAIRSLIASRVSGGGPANAEPARSDTDPALLRPEVYHQLKAPLESKYSPEDNLGALNREIDKILQLDRNDPDYERKHHSCTTSAFRLFCFRMPALLEEAEKHGMALQQKAGCSGMHDLKQRISKCTSTVVRSFFVDLLTVNYHQNLPYIIEELHADLVKLRERKFPPQKSHKRKLEQEVPVLSAAETRPLNARGSRMRVKWSSNEAKLLEDGVKLHGKSWKEIAKNIPGRSSQDCRDKFRNLRKSPQK
jgi:hypothetical protein